MKTRDRKTARPTTSAPKAKAKSSVSGENHGENHGDVQTPATGELRPQPHGGALRNGGTNKGGPGRPTDLARQLALEYGYEGLPLLRRIVRGENVRSLVGGKARMLPAPHQVQVNAEVVLLRMGGLSEKIEIEGTGPIVVSVLLGPKAAELAQRHNPPNTGG